MTKEEHFKIESLKHPQWNDTDHIGILCWVKFVGIPQEIPFLAHPQDAEPHGREVHQRLLAGEVGPIAEYVPPAKRQPTNTENQPAQGAPNVLA